MGGLVEKIVGAIVVAASIAAIPGAAMLGLLILSIEPNPRHPPSELQAAALSWAIFAAFVGGVGAIIGEIVVMEAEHGAFAICRGFVRGSMAAIAVAAFLGVSMAVLQMNTVSGQAITSSGLGALAGGTVATLGATAGAIGGIILSRAIGTLIS